jgi:hypothetical protein
VRLPPSLTTLGARVCCSCAALAAIDLRGTALRCVGGDFMAECVSLTAALLPATLEELGSGAFFNCRALPGVDLAHTALRSAGMGFLHGCAALAWLRLPATLAAVGPLSHPIAYCELGIEPGDAAAEGRALRRAATGSSSSSYSSASHGSGGSDASSDSY